MDPCFHVVYKIRHHLLHILFVTGGYFSSYGLCISSKQYGYSPRTSDVNKGIFTQRTTDQWKFEKSLMDGPHVHVQKSNMDKFNRCLSSPITNIHLFQTFFFYCLTKCMLAGQDLIKIGRFAQNLILSKLTDIILTGLEKEEL